MNNICSLGNLHHPSLKDGAPISAFLDKKAPFIFLHKEYAITPNNKLVILPIWGPGFKLHLQYCIHRYPFAVAKVFQISNQMGKYANPRMIMTENGLTTFVIYFNDNRKYKPSVEFVSSLNTWIDLEMSQFRENGKVRQ